MLAALAAGVFLLTMAGMAMAPFLLAIARDLGTDLGAVAQLFGIQAATWGAASLLAGGLSDRVGRRPLLVAGVLAMGGARLGFALASSFAAGAAWQLVSGIGGGMFMGAVFATVADEVPAAERGRALGWVMTGQSLSLLAGVPLVTLAGSLWGWRGAIAAHGAATMLTALAILATVPGATRRVARAGRPAAPLAVLLQRRLLALMGAGTMERVCFGTLAVYLPAYLQSSYGVSLAALAGTLAVVALGNVAGSPLGGIIADRTRSRPQAFALCSAATGALALPLLATQPGLAASVALGVAYSLVNALARPSLLASLSEVPGEVRGAVMGLNVTMSSLGWLGASAVGGWIVVRFGFGSLGAFCAAAGLAGAVLALAAGGQRLDSLGRR